MVYGEWVHTLEAAHLLLHAQQVVRDLVQRPPECAACPQRAEAEPESCPDCPPCPSAGPEANKALSRALEQCLDRAEQPRRLEVAVTFTVGFSAGVLLAAVVCCLVSCRRRASAPRREAPPSESVVVDTRPPGPSVITPNGLRALQ